MDCLHVETFTNNWQNEKKMKKKIIQFLNDLAYEHILYTKQFQL